MTQIMAAKDIAGVKIPDSVMARQLTRFIRDTEEDLLFHHSTRVYLCCALTGMRKGLRFDPELLYTGAIFHDIGLTEKGRGNQLRFEVDGANAARVFLRSHGVSATDVEKVWTAIALHTTPGLPEHVHREIALVTAGVEMDVLGPAYDRFAEEQRQVVVDAHPRGDHFTSDIIGTFYQGIKHHPDSTFRTANDDALALKDSTFQRMDFCGFILNSR
jgi:HD superfamily phosphodiesterase